MGYKIRTSKGASIEVESARELRLVLEILGEVDGRTATLDDNPQVDQSPPHGGHSDELPTDNSAFPERLADFRRRLSAAAQNLIDLLLRSGGNWVPDTVIRQQLEMTNNLQLAGVITGVRNNARAAQLDPDQILESRSESGPEGTRNFYRVPPETAEAMRVRRC